MRDTGAGPAGDPGESRRTARPDFQPMSSPWGEDVAVPAPCLAQPEEGLVSSERRAGGLRPTSPAGSRKAGERPRGFEASGGRDQTRTGGGRSSRSRLLRPPRNTGAPEGGLDGIRSVPITNADRWASPCGHRAAPRGPVKGRGPRAVTSGPVKKNTVRRGPVETIEGRGPPSSPPRRGPRSSTASNRH